ncbi:MAG: tetratricopeptide repeat protein [Sterolibacterium sp.]|nr:tetratricopeptide repeat protein [Sterolibacterium sp.]MBP9800578.1 tetratricopeptide repeat protein [Sterolibacterium sp.]
MSLIDHSAVLAQAQACQQNGQLAQAVQLLKGILQQEPEQAEALYQLGVLAHELEQTEQALEYLGRAVRSAPENFQYQASLGVVRYRQGDLAVARQSFEQALALPADAAQAQTHTHTQARAQVHHDLAVVLTKQGEVAAAIEHYRTADHLQPGQADVSRSLGVLLYGQGQVDAAIECYERALQANPEYAEVYFFLATALDRKGDIQGAIHRHLQAISCKPDYYDANNDLGVLLADQGLYTEARKAYERALAARPDSAATYLNLGNLFVYGLGSATEAVSCYRQAMLHAGEVAGIYSNYLFSLQYLPEIPADELFAEYRAYAERFETHWIPHWPQHERDAQRDRNPARRLRIGYVSADFCRHVVAAFIEPILVHHDKAAVEVFCYDNLGLQDDVTARLRVLADHWRPCRHLTDDQLVDDIRQDGIDILIDLSGHSLHNRLPVFARKPAPIQATWIGTAATTGLTAMDYRITDFELDPPGQTECYHSEQLMRLPDQAVYRPEPGCPEVNALPAQRGGGFTFASLNATLKINVAVIDLWSRILQTVPGSRLMLGYAESTEVRARLTERFVRNGVAEERLLFQPKLKMADYLALHHQIDLALDTFPYNGGSTTLHALWMGVPVLTLQGEWPNARAGASLMTQMGLPEFIAQDAEDYVRRAVAFSQDLPGLVQIRQSLRARLAARHVDAATITRNIETAYRQMWQRWLQSPSQKSVEVVPEGVMAAAGALTGRPAQAGWQAVLQDAWRLEAPSGLPSSSGYSQGGKVSNFDHSAVLAQAQACQQNGQLAQAVQLLKGILQQEPEQAEALYQLGVLAHELEQTEQALEYLSRAVRSAPENFQYQASLGVVRYRQGDLAGARQSFEQALHLCPEVAQCHHDLAVVLTKQGEVAAAVEHYRTADRLQPGQADTCRNLGVLLEGQGQRDEAIECFQRALVANPQYAEVHYFLAVALGKQGERLAAIRSHLRAIACKPDYSEANNDLGVLLVEQGMPEDARKAFERALAAQPDNAAAYLNLGNLYRSQGALRQAVEHYCHALTYKTDYVAAYQKLAITLMSMGELEQGLDFYRQALAHAPGDAGAFSSYLFSLQYLPGVSAEALFAEHRAYAERFETPWKAGWPAHARDHDRNRDPERRLRIGYVSADFRDHVVSVFIEPILAGHDASAFEIFCYYNFAQQDQTTERLQALVAHWRSCVEMTDDQLVDCIRQDGIDILIDLSGHTADNRLPVFARKPAPIQATWIGTAATTGLTAMDYRITDFELDPPGQTECYHSEQLMRLPAQAAYRPEPGCPEVNALPAQRCGGFTFASLNATLKINAAVIDLWSRILQAVPGSRLMLGNAESAEVRAWLTEGFARNGVAIERLFFQPKLKMLEYLALHHQIDLALDPFPYNGASTTLHALWMGVPVLTLQGAWPNARLGASLMTQVDLPEFIARDAEDYVRRAVAFSQDLPGLVQIRQSLRARLAVRNTDAAAITRNIEAAYRQMWRTWCASATPS